TAAAKGGGLFNASYYYGAGLDGTVLAKNSGPNGPDAYGKVAANFSLIGNSAGATITGSNKILNVDPLLGPLANNGGPTLTHKPQSDKALVGLSASVSDGAVTTVTLAFGGAISEFGSLADGRYTLTVLASAVASAFGNLDGNQDGVGGDDFVLASAAGPNPPTN